MYNNTFESECDEIITDLPTKDLVLANSFVNMATTAYKKYPLLFLPTFIEDFFDGMYSSKIIKKYHMLSFNHFTSLVSLLNLKSNRHRDSDLGVREKNFQDIDQHRQYTFLSKHAKKLYIPLENLLNYNILQSLVSFSIIKHEYIAGANMHDRVIEAYNTVSKKMPILSDISRKDSFEKYLDFDLTIKIHDIVKELDEQEYAIAYDGDVSVTPEYSKFLEYVHGLLNDEKRGISHSSLRRRVFDKFPLLRLAANNVQIFQEILDKLEYDGIVIQKKAFWKYTPNNDQLFTAENYNTMIEAVNRQKVMTGRTKFFGRTITSDQFIYELTSLEQGDLDDLDDQVTRIAGLALSDEVVLRSPRDDMDKFDFLIDVSNYNFRSVQVEMMKKIDFQATSNIFHCKVMINDVVTTRIVNSLKKIIPEGEQAVIFTCKPVSQNVLEQTKSDRIVQIMDENSIRNWCSITPIIPCRRHSISRVMYGDERGKIVLVVSLNYESGLAIVETIPNHVETTLPIGCLQEIDLRVSDPEDFEFASNSYLVFLTLLGSLCNNPLDHMNNAKIINVHSTKQDLLKSTKPELFGGPHPDIEYDKFESKHIRYVEFDHLYSTINMQKNLLNDSLKCTCSHHLNEEYYHTLCTHLISAIDHLCRDGLDWSVIRENIELFTEKLNLFQNANIKRSIDAIYDVIEPEARMSFKLYFHKYVNNDLSGTSSEIEKKSTNITFESLKNDVQNGLKNEPIMLELFGILEQKIISCDKDMLKNTICNLE